MKPVAEVRQETAEVLGNAVAEVARRAIRPELDPFKQSLDSLVGNLEGHAETLGEQLRAEKKALEALNKQLGEAIATGNSQAAAAADTQARVQELRERLDSLAGELAATRDEQATTVAALNSLRDEVSGWMRVSSEQADRLASVLRRAEGLAYMFGDQTRAFAEFASSVSGHFDARANDVLQCIVDLRADVAHKTLALNSDLKSTMKDEGEASRATIDDVRATVDAGVRDINGKLDSSRLALSSKVGALIVEHHARQDTLKTEMTVLIESLRRDMIARIETGFFHTVQLSESGSRQAAGDVAGLRATTETQFTSLQSELHNVIDRLCARYVDHERELAKTVRTSGRMFRVTLANLILLLVAFAIGGAAFYKAVLSTRTP